MIKYQTDLTPILNTKEYKSLVEKYKQEEEKQRQYCYKPYRTLHNYQYVDEAEFFHYITQTIQKYASKSVKKGSKDYAP